MLLGALCVVVVGGGGRGTHFPLAESSNPHLEGNFYSFFLFSLCLPAHASSSVASSISWTLSLNETLASEGHRLKSQRTTLFKAPTISR